MAGLANYGGDKTSEWRLLDFYRLAKFSLVYGE